MTKTQHGYARGHLLFALTDTRFLFAFQIKEKLFAIDPNDCMNRWWTHLQSADTAEQVVSIAGGSDPHAPTSTVESLKPKINPNIDNHGP